MNRNEWRGLTALTDPDNVLMEVVPDPPEHIKNWQRAAELGVPRDAHHPAYKGVSLRTNRTAGRHCASDECGQAHIAYGDDYFRVLRHDDTLEFFHTPCFVVEFGEALDGGQASS